MSGVQLPFASDRARTGDGRADSDRGPMHHRGGPPVVRANERGQSVPPASVAAARRPAAVEYRRDPRLPAILLGA